MENWQQEHIRRNLPALQRNTVVNETLLAVLQAADVLEYADADKLKAARKCGELVASSSLYEILPTRKNAYNILATSLKATLQTGAYVILCDGYKHKLLKDIQNNIHGFSLSDLEIILKGTSYETCIHEFYLNESCFQFTRNTTTNIPTVYIPRLISNRVILSTELFSLKCSDIFVFRGIKRAQLSSLAVLEPTSTSGEQCSKLTSRFILLETQTDWVKIKRLATEGAHLINVEKTNDSAKAQYVLEETNGKSESIWLYTKTHNKDKQAYISEDDFVAKLVNFTSPSSGIYICDKPGMGKSSLLANIARQCHIRIAAGVQTAFISLGQFVRETLVPKMPTSITERVVLECLLEAICCSNLSKEILTYALERQWINLYLFCDGFDEISLDFLETATLFLQSLCKVENCVKIFVTSRPHMKHHLESKLGFNAYEIMPFSRSTQIDFVASSWKRKSPKSDRTKLENFAMYCLNVLRKTLTQQEKDFLGNPLMCHLVTEVLEEQATIYGNPERNSNISETVLSSTNAVYNLYYRLMELRFCNKNRADQQMKLFHVREAFNVLFPEFSNEVEKCLSQTIEPTFADLPNYGILDTCGQGSTTSFAHLTFAEYLAAEKMGEVLIGKHASSLLKKVVLKMLGSNFKTTKIGKTPVYWNGFQHFDLCSFVNPVILYILNSYLDVHCSNEAEYLIHLEPHILTTTEPIVIWSIFQACVYHGYTHIFQIVQNQLKYMDPALLKAVINFNTITLLPDLEPLENGFFLVYHAAKHGDRKMMQGCLDFLKKWTTHEDNLQRIFESIDKMSVITTPLHAALERGSYDLAELLIHHFRGFLMNRGYLNACVRDSYQDSETSLQGRVQVSELLMITNPGIIFENTLGVPALCELNISLELMKFLVENGADVYSTSDSDKLTILHKATAYMNSKDFHELCRFLIEDCEAEELFQLNVETRDNPLFHILRFYNQLLEETLTMILETCEIDVNRIFTEGQNFAPFDTDQLCPTTLLHAALKGRQPIETILCLVQHQADIHLIDDGGRNALHFAAAFSQVELVEYFLSSGISVHEKDNCGNEPLLYASVDYKDSDISKIRFLIWYGADILTRNENRDTIAHIMFYNGGYRFLLRMIMWLWKHDKEKATILLTAKNTRNLTALGLDPIKTPHVLEKDILTIVSKGWNEEWEQKKNILFLSVIRDKWVDRSFLEFLIHFGADFNACDENGKFAIELAAECNSWTSFFYILTQDTKLSYLPPLRKMLLYQAITNSFPEALLQSKKFVKDFEKLIRDAVFWLLSSQYDEDDGNRYMHTITLRFSPEGYHECVTALMKNGHGHMLQVENTAGQTPLHLAVFHLPLKLETFDIIFTSSVQNQPYSKLTISSRRKNLCLPASLLNIGDKDGHSILHYALFAKRDLALIQHLVGLGANVNMEDNCNRTMADICFELGLNEHLTYFESLGVALGKPDHAFGNSNLTAKICKLYTAESSPVWGNLPILRILPRLVLNVIY